jgi:hypothetical protein
VIAEEIIDFLSLGILCFYLPLEVFNMVFDKSNSRREDFSTVLLKREREREQRSLRGKRSHGKS